MPAPNFVGAWRYRHFILSSIRTEFRARFARSKLGGLWMIIHPLAQAAIFALVLAEVMGTRLPVAAAGGRFAYAMYLLSGMLAWSLFSEIVTRCLTVFIDNGNLLKKMLFPRINLPLIIAGSALINNLLLLLAILLVFALVGHFPGPRLAWLPLLVLVTLLLALGVGLLLGVFNVFVRDVGQVVPIALQLGFWFTPIVYTPDIVPKDLRALVELNPMTPIVQGFQNIMVFDRPPQLAALAWILALTLLLLSAALVLFRRASAEMVDVL
ncbi:MAG TPA: ABC transporter permease [Casimicrobiaceae bacterium]|nr:ABC transporter permease [Casimicrobiaceae bacterium]